MVERQLSLRERMNKNTMYKTKEQVKSSDCNKCDIYRFGIVQIKIQYF